MGRYVQVCQACGNKIYEDIPAFGNKEIATIETTSSTGKATISTSNIDNALEDVKISGKKQITVSVKSNNTSTTSVTMTKTSINNIIDAGCSLVINTPTMNATFDNAALKEIQKSANSTTVELKAEIIELEDLNIDQQKSVKRRSADLIIRMEVRSGSNVVSNFGTGKVNIAIPFEFGEGRVAEDYKVLYVSDDGEIQEIAATFTNGKLILELSHFSEYMIVDHYLELTRQAGAIISIVILLIVATIAGIKIYLRKYN